MGHARIDWEDVPPKERQWIGRAAGVCLLLVVAVGLLFHFKVLGVGWTVVILFVLGVFGVSLIPQPRVAAKREEGGDIKRSEK